MFVYPERMRANLESTRGLIFSGQLLLDLVEHGVSREDAYRLVQSHAMRAWKENLNFHDSCSPTKKSPAKFRGSKSNTPSICTRQLKNVDKIFARVFPQKKSAAAKKSKRKMRADIQSARKGDAHARAPPG